MLRTAPLVGPGVDTMITRHFEAPRLLAVRGHARSWQFVHVDDVAAAVGVMLEHGLRTDHVVGAPGALPLAHVLAVSGMRAVELPEPTALSVAERLHRAGVLPAPAADLGYVVHDWTVDPAGLLAAGWEPAWSNDDCLGVVLDDVRGRFGVAGRRVGGRDAAAVGAVGAAVALLGTAASYDGAETVPPAGRRSGSSGTSAMMGPCLTRSVPVPSSSTTSTRAPDRHPSRPRLC
jgi:hypothetical protein